NSVNGKIRKVNVPIIQGVGVDDLGGCVDFLVEEGHWANSKKEEGDRASSDKAFIAPEFDFKGKKETLIHKIETEDKEQDLRLLIKQVWDKIEAKCEFVRKPRYV